MTRNRMIACVGGLVVAAGALGVGVPLAYANAGGGTCNNYGNGAVVVAPFCGATFMPAPAGPAPTTVTDPSRGPYVPAPTGPTTVTNPSRGPYVPAPTGPTTVTNPSRGPYVPAPTTLPATATNPSRGPYVPAPTTTTTANPFIGCNGSGLCLVPVGS